MFNSIYYNLRNPAFLDDIGESQLRMMMPYSSMAYESFESPSLNEFARFNMNNGQPSSDNFNGKTRSQKDWDIFKNMLKIGICAVGAMFTYKSISKLFKKFRKP